MADWPILSLITFLPLLGALIILLTNTDDAVAVRNVRVVALFFTSADFII